MFSERRDAHERQQREDVKDHDAEQQAERNRARVHASGRGRGVADGLPVAVDAPPGEDLKDERGEHGGGDECGRDLAPGQRERMADRAVDRVLVIFPSNGRRVGEPNLEVVVSRAMMDG
jgi:hypothetical protein